MTIAQALRMRTDKLQGLVFTSKVYAMLVTKLWTRVWATLTARSKELRGVPGRLHPCKLFVDPDLHRVVLEHDRLLIGL